MTNLAYTAYTEETKPVDFTYTLEGAGCGIVVEGKILLLQRSSTNKIQPGAWGIPAGKLDLGETPEQAALRETYEEAGISLTHQQLLYQGYRYFSVGYATPLNYRFHVYTVYLNQYPTIMLEPGQTAFRWVTTDEAGYLPTFTGTREVLELLFAFKN